MLVFCSTSACKRCKSIDGEGGGGEVGEVGVVGVGKGGGDVGIVVDDDDVLLFNSYSLFHAGTIVPIFGMW